MEEKYENIIVAIDGSKEAELAFQRSISIVNRNGSTLHLVNVIDTRSYVGLEALDESFSNRAKSLVLDILEEYKQRAIEQEVQDVKVIIEFGSPKEKIPHEISKKVEADLIICGATGLSSLEKFFIGSVSENIVRHANCDVLIVRSKTD